MSRSPAFQFYPDKWESGTKHLSDAAYKAYHKVLCWMWLHSKSGYSMPDTTGAWQDATGFKGGRLEGVRQEIMKKDFSLLTKRNRRLTSKGLSKEARKQTDWRDKSAAGGRKSARLRKQKKLGLDGGSTTLEDEAQPKGNTPSPSPSPSPPPSPPPGTTSPQAHGEPGTSKQKRTKRESQEERRKRIVQELMDHEKQKHRRESGLTTIGDVLKDTPSPTGTIVKQLPVDPTEPGDYDKEEPPAPDDTQDTDGPPSPEPAPDPDDIGLGLI